MAFQPLPAVLAVDVDRTLICAGVVNAACVAELRAKHAAGFEILVWSANGTIHARTACKIANIQDLSPVAIGKPRFFIDDRAWAWTKDTRRIIPRAGKKI